jgi:hypothetical protein
MLFWFSPLARQAVFAGSVPVSRWAFRFPVVTFRPARATGTFTGVGAESVRPFQRLSLPV